MNEKEAELMWIFTDEQGHIRRETNINFKDFVNKLTSFSSPNELVAMLKRPIFSEQLTYCNDLRLFNARYLQSSSQQQMAQKDQVCCLQRFVKSNGGRPFLCRTIYNRDSSSECFLITNTRDFYGSTEPENRKYVASAGDRSTIVKSKQGTNLQQTMKPLREIVQYMKFFRGIELSEVVGDFIKDEAGNWWMVNIKALRVVEKVERIRASTAKPRGGECTFRTDEQLEK
jgi:hypothetical protein